MSIKSKNLVNVTKAIVSGLNKVPGVGTKAKTKAKTAATLSKQDKKMKAAKKMFGREGMPKFGDNAKITILAKGKENPRREGTGPYKRYATILKSKTVAAFLKVHPKWRATINRAQREGFIKVS